MEISRQCDASSRVTLPAGRFAPWQEAPYGQVSVIADGKNTLGAHIADVLVRGVATNLQIALRRISRGLTYFCDGVILGSREFVEELLDARRQTTGLVRRTGAARSKASERSLKF